LIGRAPSWIWKTGEAWGEKKKGPGREARLKNKRRGRGRRRKSLSLSPPLPPLY